MNAFFRTMITVLAYLAMGGACAWIVRQCWRDSKDDFRMIAREIRDAIRRRTHTSKKKRAD